MYDSRLFNKSESKLKRKYAKDNNINLLVIPYWEFNNIEKIIDIWFERIKG